MTYKFEKTKVKCDSCAGTVEEVIEVTGHYRSSWAADNIGKSGYDYETQKCIGHRCSQCKLQYMILFGEG